VRATTAVAVEPTTVLSFPAREFLTLTKSFVGLRRLLEATSRRFQPTSSIIPSWVPKERLHLPVSEVMSSPVVTMSQDATFEQCLTQFVARKFNCFPLVDSNDRLLGLVTSTDLFGALRRDVDLQQPLASIATTNVQCIGADESVERAVEIMRRRNVKHVVVTDHERRVTGLVSMKDILEQILEAAHTATASRG
ncbi:MAG: CBS domain-containing protein, partial [Planctomycetota bacterium]